MMTQVLGEDLVQDDKQGKGALYNMKVQKEAETITDFLMSKNIGCSKQEKDLYFKEKKAKRGEVDKNPQQ